MIGRHDEELILCAPAPLRHHNIINVLDSEYWITAERLQGFIDQDLKFLDRLEAASHAISCGQINHLNWGPELYSEDLW